MKKQTAVYVHSVDSSGWWSVCAEEVNSKDKDGFYRTASHFGYETGITETIESFYLFKDENKTWWRTPETAIAALNKKLHLRYLKGTLPLKRDFEEDEENCDTGNPYRFDEPF